MKKEDEKEWEGQHGNLVTAVIYCALYLSFGCRPYCPLK